MKKLLYIIIPVLILVNFGLNVFADPSVSNVRVLPEAPNAGQDLLCNYTYSSPTNYTEQNSTFEWWKNSVNQNINSQILGKNNLSVSDQWYCKVTGYDGENFSTQVQSSNTVTISNTTQNPRLYINGSTSWNGTGYFGDLKHIFEFSDELNNALADCTPDADGFCTIPLTFSSDSAGLLNLTDLGVYYVEDRTVSLAIESITTMHSNGTLKIFEFVILNDGASTITNVQWKFDTNDSYIINSTSNLTSMVAGERAFVYVQYNFSDEGNYNVKANATGLVSSTLVGASFSSSIDVGDFAITSFDDINLDITNAIFEIQGKNNLAFNITNMNWSLATGNSDIINSSLMFNLQPNETIFIFVNYDYGKVGTFNAVATLTNQTYSDSKTTILNIKHIEAFNLSVVNESGSKRMFEFIIKNNLNQNLTTVNWTFDTKNNSIINATIASVLQSNEQMFIYIDYNFTGSGAFNTNATAINGSLTDSRNLTITI